jgi:hypothetical protein
MNVTNAMKAMVVVVGLLLAATPAGAMTGQEFLRVDDSDNVNDEMAVLKPLVRQFVMEGYHNVHDWAHLASIARALILEKGYRDETLPRSRGRRRSQMACPNERPPNFMRG